MGFDLYQVQDFIKDKGMAEANFEALIEQMNNPNYRNVLRTVQQT